MADEKSRRQTWRERGTHRPPELDDPKYDTVVVEVEPIGGGTLFWRRKKDRFKELTVWRAQPQPEDPEGRDT